MFLPGRGFRARNPELTLALASIAGFWLFYFATIAIRMAVIEESFHMLGYRALGCLLGTVLTFLVYLVLSRAAQESLKIQAIAAAIACIPAAAIFSTFNLALALHPPLVARTTVQQGDSGAAAATVKRKIEMIERATGKPFPATPAMQRQRTLRLIADGLVTWYFFFAAWASFYLAMSSAGRLRQAERRAAAAEGQAQAAQLRALRYQVNPHFLFNTLNSLSSLVMARRPEEAEEMIVNLSTFFRTSLTLDPADDVTLGQEIAFQRLYLDIETVRFPNRLRVAVDVPDALEGARVPPLILQPLVENAIKHGVARTREPVTVTIAAREEDANLILTVENDRGPDGAAAPGESGTGVGLANVCERLAARFGGAADCEAGPLPGGGYRVTLSLPLESDG